jgi:hypothetical protein
LPGFRPILILLALTSAAPLAAAAPRPAPHRPTAAAKAGPGDVTRAQMVTESNKVFDRADTNHDGFMSRTEFAARMAVVINTHQVQSKAEAQAMLDAANRAFNDVDTNHDGKLSRAEATARPLKAFDMMDANHDGVLTVAEKRAAHQNAPTLQPDAAAVDPARTGPAQVGPGR